MSAVQARIPFKSRKNTNVNPKSVRKTRSNVENINLLNTSQPLRSLKRCESDLKDHSEDESSCSPTKISRLIIKESECLKTRELDDIESTLQTKLKPLTSRETEIDWLEQFLTENLEKEQSASLYISGQPGTGKTASLTYILQLDKFKSGYTQVYVNCTAVRSAGSVYSRVCRELRLRPAGSSEKACLSAIENYLTNEHKMILLVLDEIDQLDSKRQSVLYTIFEWPALADSRLVLVGVANALDLTERSLPRLQARCSLRPRTLHFAPYTKQQIINIFTARLRDEDQASVFSPVALQMLAAKISAISGDMRRALDIGRRVIELAKRNKFTENNSVDKLMSDTTVTVELKQVLEVLNEVYGGSARIQEDVDDGFPMQQKLILCSLMLILTKGKNKDVTVGRLHDVYKRVAVARNIAPLGMGEMAGACSLLEARGALRVAGGAAGAGGGRGAGAGAGAGGARGRRLRLQWDEAALAAALRDRSMLAAILDDVSCLA